MDLTRLVRPLFDRLAQRTDCWVSQSDDVQRRLLKSLLSRAADTEYGRRYGFEELSQLQDPYASYASRVPTVSYEDIRADVMRMVAGESDILWRGKCLNYAQSSGTSGGRSKYIPIPEENLQHCHYAGATDCVAHYLRENPDSKILSGKAFILGGSFASELHPDNPAVRVGDLSATLISKINPLAARFRIPSKEVALMPDWSEKLPALVQAAARENVTNLSGVPSWFLTVIKEIMKCRGVEKISDVWPNLEVFFHGGISFEPYREVYRQITDSSKMHFMETYNASEGFFAVQNKLDDPAMLLLLDNDIFYEFIDIAGDGTPVSITGLERGHIYEMLISSSNGLWRYHLGDTVRVESLYPVKIRIAGRTKTFINAFGEELMEDNAERAVAAACRATGAAVANYTAAPLYATDNSRGRHQWFFEWAVEPTDLEHFAKVLDDTLKSLNSDYAAKRAGTIFLDPPQLITLPAGTFDSWLTTVGSGKLGGQRKIPRLSNDRRIADALLYPSGIEN
jgi:hypothetical protein